MYPKYYFSFYICLYWYLYFYIFNITIRHSVTSTPCFTICFEINFEGRGYSWSRIYLHRWIFEIKLTAVPWLTGKHRSENAVSRNCEEPPLQVINSDVLRYMWSKIFLYLGCFEKNLKVETKQNCWFLLKKKMFKILSK